MYGEDGVSYDGCLRTAMITQFDEIMDPLFGKCHLVELGA